MTTRGRVQPPGQALLWRAWRALARWLAARAPYQASEQDAARFRARQLQTVLGLTPMAMVVNVLNASLAAAVLWASAHRGFMLAWAATVSLMAAMGLKGWWTARRQPARETASQRAIGRAQVQAGVLGAVWGVMPAVVFGSIDTDARFLVGMLCTGMMCAGGFVLAAVPVAATTYAVTLGLGCMVALLQWQSHLAGPVALLMLFYLVLVVYTAWTLARSLGARLMAEARADRHNEVVGLLLRDFEDHASDLLWETDARGHLAHVTPRLLAAAGLPAATLRRWPVRAWLRRWRHPGDEARLQEEALVDLLDRGAAFRDRMLCLGRGPQPQWWLVSARPLVDDQGRRQGWRGVARDVTDKQLAHRRLRWLAHNDALTGLVNRAQFHDLLQGLLAPGQTAMLPLAVLLFDLDGFKQINDTRGHAAGDLLLQAFGARLLAVARRSDTVARLGGDEFVLLVRGADSPAALEPLLQRIRQALDAPGLVQGQPVSLRASIGVALAPADGQDVDTLLNHADTAMYAAKRDGGHRHCFFHAGLAEQGRRRLALAQALPGAAARGELRLVYQPQVDAHDAGLRGFEALLRWRHPELGEVSPAEFVPIAEADGLMHDIGAWVLAQACSRARLWPQPLQVSVNVSASQLASADLVERVTTALHGLPPTRVDLEITESALIDDMGQAVAMLARLRAQGFRIALDDFGTGYSALGYLRRLTFDALKIDRSFVTDLALDGEAQVIVDTILAMARALNLKTVAEGVETEVEAQMLRDRGCDQLQGYLISAPLEADQVADFIERWPAEGRTVRQAVQPAEPHAA